MSHPVLWPRKTYFYPIGNTSAVCLTRDISPDDPANILLLGCGDLRNILYTICADTTQAGKGADLPHKDEMLMHSIMIERRLLDFTCCDQEPGVLGEYRRFFKFLALILQRGIF